MADSKVDDYGWPSYSNDTGAGQDGTALDLAFFNLQRDAINSLTYTSSYPTVTPANTTDEIQDILALKTAPPWASLKDALDGVIDFTDGALVVPSGVVETADLQDALGTPQLLVNEDFLIWPVDTAATKFSEPAYWHLTDGGSTTDNVEQVAAKWAYSARIDQDGGSTADTVLYQDILDDGAFLTDLRTQTFGFGCWVLATASGLASIALWDGQEETEVAHSGTGGWTWLSGTHTLDGAADRLRFELRVTDAGTPSFAMPVVNHSGIAPSKPYPSPRVMGSASFGFPGAPGIADDQRRIFFKRPTLLYGIEAQVAVGKEPAGNVTIEMQKNEDPDGGVSPAWAELFTGAGAKNILTNGDSVGSSLFDCAAYRSRCLTANWPAAGSQANARNSMVRLNFTAVNGVEDITFVVQGLQYCHPWEGYRAYDDLG